jgi:hypothetical protein
VQLHTVGALLYDRVKYGLPPVKNDLWNNLIRELTSRGILFRNHVEYVET